MKICSNCQSNFADDTLQFCLNCSAQLPVSTATFSSAPAPRRNSNAALVAAILGGFLLLALAIGAVGVFYFNREQSGDEQRAAKANENSADATRNAVAQNRNARSVEIQSNSKSNNSASNLRAPAANSSAPPQLVTSASSVRKQDKGNFYFPNFAADGNSATAWCEGAPGAGEGEWLKFEFERPAMLKQIKIQPGYFKNSEVWVKNNRVSKISLEFSDGSVKEGFRLQNSMQTQTVEVGRTRTISVKIIIEEYYPGASDSDDTLISEVSFVTEP